MFIWKGVLYLHQIYKIILMKKLVLSAFLLAGFMFTSCDKNDDNTTVEEGTVDVSKMYLPSKITADDYTTIFTYNNKAQLTKIVESDGYEYTFSYSGDQLVEATAIESNIKTFYTFSQAGTKLTVNMKAEINGQTHNDTEILTLDSKGNLLNDGYFNYTYDANGNITKMKSDDSEEIVLKYDDKNGIYKNVKLPQWVFAYIMSEQLNIVNNVVDIDYEDSEFPEDNFTGTVTYNYNADNYPVKMVAKSTLEDDFSQTIEYTKK